MLPRLATLSGMIGVRVEVDRAHDVERDAVVAGELGPGAGVDGGVGCRTRSACSWRCASARYGL